MMNSIMQAAMNGFLQNQRESDMLVRLRDQLTHLGVNAELRDDNTALVVYKREPGLPVWVFVGFGGAYYSWQSAEQRHPTRDPEGAAKLLSEYIAR
ncbi:unnamed protein product [[Actinomadura] parvosata subsp. kistnae]|uniref:Uncharacterized protein n=1 Tax=[Actinomadura] parvosata subsp. kistnae TaxID=1909395 RepID=A0A1V0AAN4_9ACTN|nr:hypothetical protein [Nonomuraea sp. ATCC 55076]AQZ67233.1 hypothetical protein BKM31_42435 [Nonomuraea sp. ATCC 55076]SPL94551.1 unnamed protein product [Actinomadura parvosata subsp. kistnae]